MRRLALCLYLLAALPAQAQSPDSYNARLEVRLSQMAEEIRELRGRVEEAQYAARQNAEALERFRGDADYRLQAMEQKLAEAQAAAAAAEAALPEPTGETLVPAEQPSAPAAYQPEEASPSPTGRDFPNSNAHYSHAFKQLNDKNYAGAAASFDAFVKKYPEDPLTGNAYYWLGESYYARGDYTRAIEGFRKGFEVNPDGQKAADNLLKLAMSLSKVKRVKEACIVLKQVSSNYGENNPRTANKAAAEMSALQCK